jgi:hypothetical protein
MQTNFRNILLTQNDPVLAEILTISQQDMKDMEYNNSEDFRKPIKILKYLQTKDYARTYINLKNRNRYNISDYIQIFKQTLQELKVLVEKELEI